MNITYATPDDQEKIKLVERVFNSLTKEELQQLLGHDLVVEKLKGIPDRTGIISSLLMDNMSHDADKMALKNEVMALRGELIQVKIDLASIIKFVNVLNDKLTGYNSEQSNFNTMKSKYGIY
jgi:WD40 repeat protein